MKAKKTIWYGHVPPKNDKGEYQTNAIFDKRIKKIGVGEDVRNIEGVKIDNDALKRMEADGIVGLKVEAEVLAKVEAEKQEAKAEAQKADNKASVSTSKSK